jgi:hypothetical protein
MAKYREVREDLPDQIIGWADSQIRHRMELERVTTAGAERRKLVGQLGSFGVALTGLFLASAVATYGNAWTAAIIAIVAVGGPTAATILSSRLAIAPPLPQPAPPSGTRPRGGKNRAQKASRP